MKRTLLFAGLALHCWGALSTAVNWEAWPTTGSDTNGGLYDASVTSPGTNFSQQTTPHVAFNGTTITATTAGVTATIVITGYTVLATDNGNGLQITGGIGFLTGFYEITSVNTVANTWTLDRNATSSAATGMTGNMGGALATVATANANAAANNTIWIKNTGTYTATSALTVNSNSTGVPGTPLAFLGYGTTHGDRVQVTWTTSTNSIDLVDFTNSYNILFENIIFTDTAGTPGDGFNALTTGNSTLVMVVNCKFSGFNIGINGNFNVAWSFQQLVVVDTRITTSVSHGLLNAGNTYIYGSLFDNNGGDGAQWMQANSGAEFWMVQNSVFYKNANGINILYQAAANFTGMTISNNDFSTNVSAGARLGNNTFSPAAIFQNNIMDDNGTYGVDAQSNTTFLPFLFYTNAFYNNTLAPTRGMNAGIGTITLTANPYQNPSGLNFALNSTAGGGAALTALGFPGETFTSPMGNGFESVGALQGKVFIPGAGGMPVIQLGFPGVH